MIKAVLHDFDGSLVTKDILDVVCGIVGKEKESRRLNEEFQQRLRPGVPSLIERINFLRGVSINEIKEKLEENAYLMPGAVEWMKFLKDKGIVTILYSGNIEPILLYYQRLLGFDYIVGTKPKMDGGKIVSIRQEDFPEKNWKLVGIENALNKNGIKPEETLVIGDSLADKPIFEFAGKSIAINPKGGIEKYADYNIEGDLILAKDIVRKEIGLGSIEEEYKKRLP